MQPAPAFQHNRLVIVVGRIINLEEALRAAFVVDDRTIAFGEACRGKHQMRVFHNRRALMVNHHHQRRFGERSVHARSACMTVEIVFQHHHGVRAAGFQLARLNHLTATGVSAGDNQRFFRAGQRLHNDINFVL